MQHNEKSQQIKLGNNEAPKFIKPKYELAIIGFWNFLEVVGLKKYTCITYACLECPEKLGV